MRNTPDNYCATKDPPLIREVRWLLNWSTFILLGWWLVIIKHYWPGSARVVNQVPNAMSVFRIIVSPFVTYQLGASILTDDHASAWLWLGIVGGLIILDGLDGPLARQLDAVSDFGKAIDPAADKLLILVLAITYCVTVWQLQGWVVFVPLCGALIWVIWVEFKLILIARDTKIIIDRLEDQELPGANVFGKIKFTIQSLSFVLAYVLLIADSSSLVGALWLTCMLIVARFFADKSLHQHRVDLWALQNLARQRRLAVPNTRSAKELVRWATHNNQAS